MKYLHPLLHAKYKEPTVFIRGMMHCTVGPDVLDGSVHGFSDAGIQQSFLGVVFGDQEETSWRTVKLGHNDQPVQG